MSDKTQDLLNERAEHYGNPVDTHVRIAQVWSGILGHEVKPVEAALMMAGLKMVRAAKSPAHKDSYDDAHAYITIAGDEIMGLRKEETTEETDPPRPTVFSLRCQNTECLNTSAIFQSVLMPSPAATGTEVKMHRNCPECGKAILRVVVKKEDGTWK